VAAKQDLAEQDCRKRGGGMKYEINSRDLEVALAALSMDAQTLRKIADGIGETSGYFIESAERREAACESIKAQMYEQWKEKV